MKEQQDLASLGLRSSPQQKFLRKLRLWSRKLYLWDLLGSLILSLVIALMLRTNSRGPDVPLWREGEIAAYSVKVHADVELEDVEATAADREQILAQVPVVYDYDSAAVGEWVNRWREGVIALRRSQASLVSKKMKLQLDNLELQTLSRLSKMPDFDKTATFAFAPFWRMKIVDSRVEGAPRLAGEIVDLATGASLQLNPAEVATLPTIDEARARLVQAFQKEAQPRRLQLPWQRWKVADREVVRGVLSRLMGANVTLNKKESESKKIAALKDFRPLVQKLSRNEVIVRDGERVGKKTAQILAALNARNDKEKRPVRVPFEAFFGGLSLWLVVVFIRRQYPKLLGKSKDALVLMGTLVISLAAFKLSLIFELEVLAQYFVKVPTTFFLFVIPLAAPAMILRLLLNPALATLFSLLFALTTSFLLGPNSLLFSAHVLTTSFAGILFMAHCRTRTAFYRAGLFTALLCGLSALGLSLVWGGQIPSGLGGELQLKGMLGIKALLWAAGGGLLGGWLSSALALALTPILEKFLDYTTDLKLLELARMDHPLLRELVLKAPGTYHHSIIVGSLVEAGAEAIHANALLARVGSYYHDIGKIGRAEYFVENQAPGQNPHDKTKPQLSAKIIISHVKEGKIMAENHKLGKSIIAFIEEHHGDSVVTYFYNKAKQEAAQPNSGLNPEDIREEDFRYPGPKPHSKESAIMALADKCEAATRSLVDPTPARIEGLVHKIITNSYSEGLLDDADITLREVALVEKAFVRILLGIHHNRIQYPGQEQGLPPQNALSLIKSSK